MLTCKSVSIDWAHNVLHISIWLMSSQSSWNATYTACTLLLNSSAVGTEIKVHGIALRRTRMTR